MVYFILFLFYYNKTKQNENKQNTVLSPFMPLEKGLIPLASVESQTQANSAS